MKPNFPAYAEIDLDKLHQNLDLLSKTSQVPLAPVIKANGYGHGAVGLAKELISRRDVLALCVGTMDEGMELRKVGVKGRVIVLDGILAEQAKNVAQNNLEVVISSIETARALAAAGAGGKPVSVHLKINTGMTRLGSDPEGALDFYKKTAKIKKLTIAGVMTHLADSGKRKGLTSIQTTLFDDILSSIRASGFDPPPLHAANTAAAFLHPESRYDFIRPGIGIYGIQEFGGRDVGLKPILSLRARVMMARQVTKGTPVSYGMTWASPGKRNVAVVSIGYADGYMRSLSNKTHAIINGKKIKQIGVICMDNCLFDITGTNAATNDLVTLIGEDKGVSVKAEQLARIAKTITYEILCGIGRRIPRVYIRSGKVEKISERF